MNHEHSLVILTPGFPVNEDDSTCLPYIQVFIRSLQKNFPGTKLHILSFQYPYSNSDYHWHNIPVHSFGGRNRGGLARIWLWFRVARKLSRLKKEINFSGILSFWAGECALVGQRWANNNSTRHICLVMGQDAKKENHYLKRIKPKTENLVSLSDFNAAELFRNHGINPSHVIPLGVDPDQFPAAEVDRDIDLLCAGSLIPLKQFHLCIGIIQEIKKIYPHVRMKICGKGPCEKDLRSLITTNGLEKNIRLEGEIAHSELLGLMKRSKIFLHPSSYEGFGQVCPEARAAGTPVISFIKPMNEAIPGWYTVASKEEMTKKCMELLGSKIDHKAIHPYTADESSRRFMALFNASHTS